MAVTHSTAVKVVIATAVRTALIAGSGSLQAVEFQKSDDTVLVSIALATTPWGAPNGSGTIAAAGLSANGTVGGGGGTATKGRVKDKDGTVCVNFAVGLSGSDVNFDAVAWTVSGTVTLSSLTYTPA